MLKTNFDGAMFADSNQAGVEVVIWVRTSHGSVIHKNHKTTIERNPRDVGVQFALELGFEHFVFKGDSEVIIKAVVDIIFSLASIINLVKDIMSISGLLQTQSFSHVRRHDNVVAHALV